MQSRSAPDDLDHDDFASTSDRRLARVWWCWAWRFAGRSEFANRHLEDDSIVIAARGASLQFAARQVPPESPQSPGERRGCVTPRCSENERGRPPEIPAPLSPTFVRNPIRYRLFVPMQCRPFPSHDPVEWTRRSLCHPVESAGDAAHAVTTVALRFRIVFLLTGNRVRCIKLKG